MTASPQPVWTCASTRRSLEKDTNPGKWDVSCAGHITGSDDSRETAVREIYEEIGLEVTDATELEFLWTAVSSGAGETKHGAYHDNELQVWCGCLLTRGSK